MILYIVNAGLGWVDSVLLAHSGKGVCVGIVTGYGPGLVMGSCPPTRWLVEELSAGFFW